MLKTNQYDIAVGIPSYNEAKYIRFVVTQIDKGINKYFNHLNCILINLDSKSTDNTKEIFLKTPTLSAKMYTSTPKGKGGAMLHFFKFCLDNKIPCIATIDADLKTVTPVWIYKLLKPILDGYDYTVPVYTRNRFEANITNHFAYPLILASYGVELRQPLGGEFGYSANFCRYLLKHPKHLKTYGFGIDIFISCCALFGNFKIKETYLGKKIHAPSFYHMESTFRQVFESGIFMIRSYRDKNFKVGKIEKSHRSSGIDEFKYFPHKKSITRLKKQLKRRFFRYKRKGLYDKFVANKVLMNKIASIIRNNDVSSLDGNIWTDYLAYITKTCTGNNFDTRELKIVSRITIPIYRWRAITYWLAVENVKPKEAERIIRDQAKLLKNKMKWYNHGKNE